MSSIHRAAEKEEKQGREEVAVFTGGLRSNRRRLRPWATEQNFQEGKKGNLVTEEGCPPMPETDRKPTK